MNTVDANMICRNQFGAYSYASFTAFAMDCSGNTKGAKNWTTFSQRFGNPRVDTTIRDINWYAQDQFRIAPSLTLNYGIRYELAQLPQPKVVNPDYPETGRIPEVKTNFAPRLGMAYAFNKSKTVLRAGYGIFYARYQGGLINTFFLENGVYQKEISLSASRPDELAAGPVFPNRLSGTDRNPPAGRKAHRSWSSGAVWCSLRCTRPGSGTATARWRVIWRTTGSFRRSPRWPRRSPPPRR
jgi:hypothetical protein